jgi:hypothetical protein
MICSGLDGEDRDIRRRDDPDSFINLRTMSTTDDFARLADLHAEGFLTDEQYESARRKVEERAARDSAGRLPLSPLTEPNDRDDRRSSPAGDRPPSLHSGTRPPDRIDAGWKIVRNLLLLLLILGGMGFVIALLAGAFRAADNSPALREIAPPRPAPVVVEQSLNNDESSIWDVSITVVGRVRNKGGDGRVLIKEVVEQGGRYFFHEDHHYLDHGEECAVKHTFSEVTAGGGRMRGHIEVYPE